MTLSAHKIARLCPLVAAALLLPVAACAQGQAGIAVNAPQLLAEAVAPAAFAVAAHTQSFEATTSVSLAADAESSSSLPDDPATVALGQQDSHASLPPTPPKNPVVNNGPPADKWALTIGADQTAQALTTKQKIGLGFRDLYSPLNFVGVFASAGYEQATNGAPNYGTDRGAFGQRLGAAQLREMSEVIFTEALLHPLMHTDARYYVKGSNYGFGTRAKYAVTRLFVTRKDGGGSTVNSALLLGYLEASSMTRFYYPTNNRNLKDLFTGYGGSLGGEAIAFLFEEFSDSVLRGMHIKH